MVSHAFRRPVIALLVATCLLHASRAEEYRTWTSSAGTTIEAVLIADEAGRVQLRTREGRSITLPVTQLSQEDRAYLDERNAAGPAPDILSEQEDDGAWYASRKPGAGKFQVEVMLKAKDKASFDFASPVESGSLTLHIVYEEEDKLVEYARRTREGIRMSIPMGEGKSVEEMLTGKSSARPATAKDGRVRFGLENLTTTSTRIAFWLEEG